MVGCSGFRAQASERYIPPRNECTASGGSLLASVVPPPPRRRKRSATVLRMPPSAPSSFLASCLARSWASSTMMRRSTTKKIRRGAVTPRPAPERSAWAWAARANTAMSMQAVLPAPVGRAMTSGQGRGSSMPTAGRSAPSAASSTLPARADCHANASSPQSSAKNSGKFVWSSLVILVQGTRSVTPKERYWAGALLASRRHRTGYNAGRRWYLELPAGLDLPAGCRARRHGLHEER